MPRKRAAVLAMPELGPPPAPRVPQVVRRTLSNGLRVVAAPRPGIPQAVLRVVVPAGSVADPAEHPGAASLVGSLLTEGTQRLSADDLNARLDFLGAAVSATVGHDYAEVEAFLLSETLEEGIGLFAEMVTKPTFPAAETERVRAEALDALVGRLDEPANVADDRASLEAFGADHPYGPPAFGTEEGIRDVPREALAALHARTWLPGGSFLCAGGNFDVEELFDLLERELSGWTGEAPRAVYPPSRPRPERAGELVALPWPDAMQSEIRLVGTGMDRRSPDWVPAVVANYVLGGSTITGRLGANLREDKGWTYGARSSFSAGVAQGGWTADTAVDVDVTADAVEEMLREMRRMMDEPVPSDELRRAKDALVLSLPRAFETPSRIASRMATLEAYGLPHDYWETFPAAVEAVTAQDVVRIARDHFDPEKVVRVVVGGGIG